MKTTIIGIVLMLLVLVGLYFVTKKPAEQDGNNPVITTPQDQPAATNFNL